MFDELRVEGCRKLFDGAREIDQHSVRVHSIDLEAVRLQPVRDLLYVFFGYAELLAELFRRKPLVEVG